MLNHTFLLTNYNTFSIQTTRVALIGFGLLILIFSFAEVIVSTTAIPKNPFLVLLAINFILIGTIGLSKKSRFSPKLKISDDQIIFKEKIFSGQKIIPWNSVNQIQLGSYKATFITRNKKFTLKFDTHKENSIAIKQALREASITKGVEIVGT